MPSILATMCSTIVAVLVARALSGRTRFAPERFEELAEDTDASVAPLQAITRLEQAEDVAATRPPVSPMRTRTLAGFALLIGAALAIHLRDAAAAAGMAAALREVANSWLLPLLMAAIVLFGFSYRIGVYDSFIRGAREGFDIAVMIIPYLVAILVAVGMFRASGALDALVAAVSPLTSLVGFPAEALPMALIRPLSGSGAMGVMTAIMTEYGPDSFVGYLVSVMNGSTETTFLCDRSLLWKCPGACRTPHSGRLSDGRRGGNHGRAAVEPIILLRGRLPSSGRGGCERLRQCACAV